MSQSPGILLDTTVVIDALRNRNERRQFLAEVIRSGDSLVISTVTIAEVYAGVRPGEESGTGALLAGLGWIPVSASIAQRAGELKGELRRQGQTRSVTDMIIAATALELGASLATDNVSDFQIPGLALFPLP